MNSVQEYKLQKKQRWINHQLAQGMIVFCYSNNRLVVIKKVKKTNDGLVAYNGPKSILLKTQPIYASKSDFVNPVGVFRDEPLEVAEYVDLICKCIW